MGTAVFTIAPVTAAQDASRAGVSPNGVTSDGKRYVEGNLTFTGTYATGGDALATTNLPFKRVKRLDIIGSNTFGSSIVLAGTELVPLVKVHGSSIAGAAAEIANAVNLTGRAAVRVRLIGE